MARGTKATSLKGELQENRSGVRQTADGERSSAQVNFLALTGNSMTDIIPITPGKFPTVKHGGGSTAVGMLLLSTEQLQPEGGVGVQVCWEGG